MRPGFFVPLARLGIKFKITKRSKADRHIWINFIVPSKVLELQQTAFTLAFTPNAITQIPAICSISNGHLTFHCCKCHFWISPYSFKRLQSAVARKVTFIHAAPKRNIPPLGWRGGGGEAAGGTHSFALGKH